MRFFIGSYIYDIILLILCGVVFKTFILKKGLSEKESFFIRHTLPIIYIPLSVLLIVNMVYIVLIDREIIDNTYKGKNHQCKGHTKSRRGSIGKLLKHSLVKYVYQ